MLKATVIYVSECSEKTIEDMKMIPASTVEEALLKARKILKKDDATVTVIPDGVSVIVER